MSQRPQRAAAIQAIRANAATLSSPRRRIDPQASNKSSSPSHFSSEDREREERRPSSMDVKMQRSSHYDLRRLESTGYSNSSTAAYDASSSSYNADTSQTYWPDQDHSSAVTSHASAQGNSAASCHPQQIWENSDAKQHSAQQESVSTHNIFDLHYPYAPQSNSLGLKGESGLHVGLDGSLDLNEGASYPHRSLDTASDGLALLDSLPFKPCSGADNDSYEDSTDSDLPPEKKKLSAAFRPRGRKKRNKCTPDQLRSLEAFFEKNRNPTGRVRYELSRKLRMPERSVQVWFQNRRAKLKTHEQRNEAIPDASRKKSYSIQLSDKDAYKAAGPSGRSVRDTAEQTPSVTAIPTSALCIGTWRRVSPLICFFSRRLQSLTWYLTSESIGFKLEIPWTSLRGAYFDGPIHPSVAERAEGVRVPLGQFVIDLERPPTFFMEVFRSSPLKDGSTEAPRVSWRQCEDFTEDRQAMTVSRHVLNGPYEELRFAVQSLAACNEVLRRLIHFRDEEQRAAGSIPTGTGSTADNFGLVNHLVYRPVDAFMPSVETCSALTGGNAYGQSVQMPMQPAATSGSSSSLQKSATWNAFRTPTRLGGEHGWEFDSPASVTTNLSDASLDSHQRHQLGYSPYGMPSSIEASPRSGLSGSMDLNTLRIDAGGMPSNYTAAGSMPLMSDGSMNGSRGQLGGWDGRLGYDMSAPQHTDAQYSLASSGILPGDSSTGHAMQPSGGLQTVGMDTGDAMQYNRHTMMERQDFHGYDMGGHGHGQHQHQHQHQQHQTGEPSAGMSFSQEGHHDAYESKCAPSDADVGISGSLLLSRRFSHNPGMDQGDYPRDVGERETNGISRPSSQGGQPTFAVHPAPTSVASTANAKFPSFEEDAFCSKTPTYRTSFGNPLQLSQASAQDQNVYADRRAIDTSLSGSRIEEIYDDDDENTAAGRARSNTYRPSTHGGGRFVDHGHRSDEDGEGDDVDPDNREESDGEEEDAVKSRANSATGAESPGLLTLSEEDLRQHTDSPVLRIEELP